MKQLYDKSKVENLISTELTRKKSQFLITSKYTSASLIFSSNQNIITFMKMYLQNRIQYAVSH